jgi:hypothetical protein
LLGLAAAIFRPAVLTVRLTQAPAPGVCALAVGLVNSICSR